MIDEDIGEYKVNRSDYSINQSGISHIINKIEKIFPCGK